MGVELISPDFKGRHRSQMTVDEAARSAGRPIAEKCIHVTLNAFGELQAPIIRK